MKFICKKNKLKIIFLKSPFAKKCAFEKPIIDQAVKGENLFCPALEIKFFDLKTVPINEPYDKTTVGFSFKAEKSGLFLQFSLIFNLRILFWNEKKKTNKNTAPMHGFVAWFDVLFRGSGQEVILSTKPGLKYSKDFFEDKMIIFRLFIWNCFFFFTKKRYSLASIVVIIWWTCSSFRRTSN